MVIFSARNHPHLPQGGRTPELTAARKALEAVRDNKLSTQQECEELPTETIDQDVCQCGALGFQNRTVMKKRLWVCGR
jgi:hypothetical protein